MGLFGTCFYFVFSNHNFFSTFQIKIWNLFEFSFWKKILFGTLFSSHILKLNLNKFFCLAVCFQFKFWVAFTYILEDYPLPQFFFFLFFGHPFSPPHTWATTPSPISLFFSPTTHLLHFFTLTCSDLTYSIFTYFLFLLNPQSSVVHPKIHACISVLQSSPSLTSSTIFLFLFFLLLYFPLNQPSLTSSTIFFPSFFPPQSTLTDWGTFSYEFCDFFSSFFSPLPSECLWPLWSFIFYFPSDVGWSLSPT